MKREINLSKVSENILKINQYIIVLVRFPFSGSLTFSLFDM